MNRSEINKARAWLKQALGLLLASGECWCAAVRVQAALNVLRRGRKQRSRTNATPWRMT
jgi:hypothetical protein